MAEKKDVAMNTFTPATDAEYIYAEVSDGSQVKISIDDIFNIALNKVNTYIDVTYNTQTLIAEGVGFLIIQESWTTVDVSVFFVSMNMIRAIIDDYNSIYKLSVVGGKVYWTENSPSHTSIRRWFWGLNGRFATS